VKVIYFVAGHHASVVVSLLWLWLLRDAGALNQALGLCWDNRAKLAAKPAFPRWPAIVIVSRPGRRWGTT